MNFISLVMCICITYVCLFYSFRNHDFQEVIIETEDNKPLKFALAYGFRNIQNIVQKIKRNKCGYHFVEIMACPSGCNNGGGQIRPVGDETAKERLKSVEQIYDNIPCILPSQVTEVSQLYDEWLGGQNSEKSKQLLHTQYHEIEKNTSLLAIKW